MLFNSYLFIFAFLPITLLGTYFLRQICKVAVVPWLLLASMVFYAWWNPLYVILLVVSICFNYLVGKQIIRTEEQRQRKATLILGIVGNLAALIYFKYTNFFLHNINQLLSTHFNLYTIILPLGISFFTFTQMAFLIDAYYKKVTKVNFIDFSLFVTYFPHLIAGPIIHHHDVMPQFKKLLAPERVPVLRCFIVGLTVFALGLFKKVCIADTLAPHVDNIFHVAGAGYDISLVDSWIGAISYTFQLYFDFSGYSDMAIGLSYMLGIKLPANFYSPYKALNIVDFWRRWHMSLSRFFRDYLYIPLGGSRRGALRKYLNLLLVMVIVGFWHGAGWTFIIWGTYHGLLLVLNHGWHFINKNTLYKQWHRPRFVLFLERFIARLATFFCVVLGWVMFRASDIDVAKNIYYGMFHYHEYYYGSLGMVTLLNYVFMGAFLLACFLIVFLLPSTMEIMRKTNAVFDSKTIPWNNYGSLKVTVANRYSWSPSLGYALIIGMLTYLAVSAIGSTSTSFLYFNF